METKRKYIPKYTIQGLVEIERKGDGYRDKINKFEKSLERKEGKEFLYHILPNETNCYPEKKYNPFPEEEPKEILVKRTLREAEIIAWYSSHEISA